MNSRVRIPVRHYRRVRFGRIEHVRDHTRGHPHRRMLC